MRNTGLPGGQKNAAVHILEKELLETRSKKKQKWILILGIFIGIGVAVCFFGCLAPIDSMQSWNPVTIWRQLYANTQNPILFLFFRESWDAQNAAAGSLVTASLGYLGMVAKKKIPALDDSKGSPSTDPVGSPKKATRDIEITYLGQDRSDRGRDCIGYRSPTKYVREILSSYSPTTLARLFHVMRGEDGPGELRPRRLTLPY